MGEQLALPGLGTVRQVKKHRSDISRSAEISDCGRYRWWLRRSWPDGDGRVVCFVMLNPSKADALIDDPTIRRCIGFARRWGFSGISVRNLFPYRATDPKELLTAENPTGGDRGDAELQAATTADLVVVAWGANVPHGREAAAERIFAGTSLYCLGTTKHGKPRHPVRLPGATELVPFRFN